MEKLAFVLMAGVRFLAGGPKFFGRRVVDFGACGGFWGGWDVDLAREEVARRHDMHNATRFIDNVLATHSRQPPTRDTLFCSHICSPLCNPHTSILFSVPIQSSPKLTKDVSILSPISPADLRAEDSARN
jgi:hypothetical protein